jgi:integrase/recombinase XerD
MRVQRVLVEGAGAESWTVLGADGDPVEPIERFLGYLSAVERSPNTVKAYAHDLKDWFTFLRGRDVDWRSARVEDVAAFVAWLRLPPAARAGRVVVLPTVAHHCAASSVNRKLAALTSFCEFHARHGVALAGLMITAGPGRRGGSVSSFGGSSYRPFLHHISKSSPQRRRTVKLPAVPPSPKVLTVVEAQAILEACDHLRDRLLFAVLLDTGARIGEVLGLRHDDLAIAEQQVLITPRENDNRARVKGQRPRTIPASAELMRLYADYLTGEYGALDCDYVFVNLWAAPLGRPMSYPAVYDLVGRLRRRSGISFGPHLFRHTYATWLLRRGAGMETVKELLGHASISTTVDTYGHLSVEDARRTLQAAGWFTGREVNL